MEEIVIIQDYVAELYPFTAGELDFFKEDLNFTYVSLNRKIDWNYALIKEFEEFWDWKVLDTNQIVFDRITLGLLFPNRIELRKCNCWRKDDLCEDAKCQVNMNRLKRVFRYDKIYLRLITICEIGLLDDEILFELYKNDNIGLVQDLIDSFSSGY